MLSSCKIRSAPFPSSAALRLTAAAVDDASMGRLRCVMRGPGTVMLHVGQPRLTCIGHADLAPGIPMGAATTAGLIGHAQLAAGVPMRPRTTARLARRVRHTHVSSRDPMRAGTALVLISHARTLAGIPVRAGAAALRVSDAGLARRIPMGPRPA